MAFFIFSFLHCFTQGTIQSFLFSADDSYGFRISEIVARGNINPTIFPVFTGRHGKYSLALCDQVPVMGGGPDPCDPFFTVGQSGPITIPPRFLPSAAERDAPSVRQLFLNSFDLTLTFRSFVQSSGSFGQTNVVGLLYKDPSNPLSPFSRPHLFWSSMVEIFISTRSQGLMGSRTSSSLQPTETRRSPSSPSVHSPSCIRRPSKCWCICVHISVLFLTSSCRMGQTRREELSLIGSQFWFFGLAVFAVSICATFLTFGRC